MNKTRYTYLTTYLTEFSLLVAGLLVYRFASVSFDSVDFASYSLIRRNLSFFIPVLFLGLAVGIPRFISYNHEDKMKSGNYFLAGCIVLFLSLLLFSIIVFALKNQLAQLLFGDSKYYYLMYPLLAMTYGLSLHSVIYAYLRGSLKMNYANLLQILNLGIGILVVFLFTKHLVYVIYLTSIIWSLTSLIFFVFIFSKLQYSGKEILASAKELLRYSTPRVPGDLALASLLTVPSIIVAHYVGIVPAGFLAFGITILNMAGAAFSPVSLLLLPSVSKLASENRYLEIFANTKKIIGITLLLSVVAVLVFELFASFILKIYLGNAPEELVNTTRLIALGIPGYTIYIVLRSVLDALHYKAINTKNLLISCALYFVGIALILILLPKDAMQVTLNLILFAISLTALGILTYFDIAKSKKHFLN
jgi:O-antigen/teichoic acid export membrane protein